MPDIAPVTFSLPRQIRHNVSASTSRWAWRILICCLAGLFFSTVGHAAAQNVSEGATPPGKALPGENPPRLSAPDARHGDASDLDAVRRELCQTVTEKTRLRLENMKKRKMLSPAVADLKLSRLAGAEDPAYLDQAALDAQARIVPVLGSDPPSQYFVYVDRNPARQLIFVGFFDAGTKKVELLGADLVSTGLLRRGQDSFLTPTGVFEHLPGNFGYRAQGTKNERGWRGLGGKGSRVWDFGFQQSPREFRRGVYESQMRLLMHATDPDHGEPRLGGMDSKGCVRVSANMNHFLDRRSILDRHYERLASEMPDMWLLAPDRIPVSAPGSFMVVGDSSATEKAAR